MVEPAHLKNISQIGSFPQIGVKINNIWNHQPGVVFLGGGSINSSISSWCMLVPGKSLQPPKTKTKHAKKPWPFYPLFGGHDFAFEFGSRFQLTIPKRSQTRRIARSVSFCHHLLSCTAFLRRKASSSQSHNDCTFKLSGLVNFSHSQNKNVCGFLLIKPTSQNKKILEIQVMFWQLISLFFISCFKNRQFLCCTI